MDTRNDTEKFAAAIAYLKASDAKRVNDRRRPDPDQVAYTEVRTDSYGTVIDSRTTTEKGELIADWKGTTAMTATNPERLIDVSLHFDGEGATFPAKQAERTGNLFITIDTARDLAERYPLLKDDEVIGDYVNGRVMMAESTYRGLLLEIGHWDVNFSEGDGVAE